ncbi:flagellar protein FlgN [Halobacillus halophilus]|uniref:flagellar protein FlgN n=1 Tax=Halobacillus halophilus TaxID=1570 RepID=UPI001CD65E5A|nr:flagellar protein FlgN [Halobacillus halophilus]MCA1011249.1 flagellar protein FlgN [Halobacillus halophilus]
MTLKSVIQCMDQLKQVHESLLVLSRKKTEALKSNDTSGLQQLLTQERKHVQAINKVEKQRVEAVVSWCEAQGLSTYEPTISRIIANLEGDAQSKLEAIYEEMLLVLSNLKQQEQLNAQLTKQSLQFINMSLDMLQPSLESVNYGGKSASSKNNKSKRSTFDSKA